MWSARKRLTRADTDHASLLGALKLNTAILGAVKLEGKTLGELLPPTILKKLANALVPRTYLAGAPLFVEGDSGDTFYIIKSVRCPPVRIRGFPYVTDAVPIAANCGRAPSRFAQRRWASSSP